MNTESKNSESKVEITIVRPSLIDLIQILLKKRKIIYKTTVVFISIGFLYAIFSPKEFTSTAKLMPDLENESNIGVSRLAAISRSFGFDFGTSTQGITGEIYPDIVTSREVLYKVIKDTLIIDNQKTTFIEYFLNNQNFIQKWIRNIFNIPGRLVKVILGSDRKLPVFEDNTVVYTENEVKAMKTLADGMLKLNMDLNKGVLNIAIIAESRELAVQLLQGFIHHLINRIQSIFTEKSSQNYIFIKSRYGQAENDLNEAEKKLADFIDQNLEVDNAALKLEQDRLERNVRFKIELFSEIQKELTRSEIELQKSKPVLTILEYPNFPIEKSHPRRILIIISFLLIGIIFSLLFILVQNYFEKTRLDSEGKAELETISKHFRKYTPKFIKKIFTP
jgi:tyrosine-protein kinase Etk/Wzc